MKRRFKVGDHVSWHSEAGRLTGTIINVVTSETEFKAIHDMRLTTSRKYEIKSDKTDHVVMGNGSALRKLSR